MDFIFKDLGILSGGEVVEVVLKRNAANVRLMDSSNFMSFRNERPYRANARYVTQSPYRVQVPHAGHWYLVLDLGGNAGTIEYSARLVK